MAAAAVGLILFTVSELSKKSLEDKFDFVFVALTVIAVNRLHESVPRTLLAVGLLTLMSIGNIAITQNRIAHLVAPLW